MNHCFLQSEREQEAENLEGEKVKAYVYAYIALLCDRCEYLKVNILFWWLSDYFLILDRNIRKELWKAILYLFATVEFFLILGLIVKKGNSASNFHLILWKMKHLAGICT